jgi:hypothetical protein
MFTGHYRRVLLTVSYLNIGICRLPLAVAREKPPLDFRRPSHRGPVRLSIYSIDALGRNVKEDVERGA